jgi:hypothetical protein
MRILPSVVSFKARFEIFGKAYVESLRGDLGLQDVNIVEFHPPGLPRLLCCVRSGRAGALALDYHAIMPAFTGGFSAAVSAF